MNEHYKANWPLADEYLIELGRITSLWASLESFLNLRVGKLAGFDVIADPTPLILITHSSFPQRLDMLNALCEELKAVEPQLSNHKEVVSQIKAAQTARNRYAHNGISFDAKSNNHHLGEASARGKVKTAITPIKAEELHEVAKQIHLATLALYKLVLKVEIRPIWEKKAPANAADA